MDRYLKNS